MITKKIITHLLSLALITAALLILNYPILLNADFFAQFDEIAQAAFTVNLMKFHSFRESAEITCCREWKGPGLFGPGIQVSLY